MSFIAELKRRNVFRVAAAYVAVSWLIIQVVETLFPIFGLTEAAIRIVVILLVVGFIPAVAVSWAFEWTPSGFRREEQVDHGSATSRRMSRRLDRVFLAALALALGLFAVDKFVMDPARDAAELAAATEQARQEGRKEAEEEERDNSIAVLALQDLSPEGDQEYFCDGLSVDLLNQLAKIPEIRVTGKTSAFSFKGENVTIPEIGDALNVAHVLDGTVSKAGDRIRISVQLVDARTDTAVWSQEYDRTLDDIFAIRDEITDRIVDELETELSRVLPKSPRTAARVYELTLRARYLMDHQDTDDDIEHAAKLLDEALAIDPDYVPALIEGIIVRYRMMSMGLLDEAEERDKGNAAVRRVLALDPDNGNALALLAWDDWEGRMDLEAAAKGFTRAVETDPGDPEALHAAGIFARTIGRHEQSIALIEQCAAADPLNLRCIFHLGLSYLWAERLDEAMTMFERHERLTGRQGAIRYTVMTRLLQGEPALALDALDAADIHSDSPQILASLAMTLHDLGRNDESATALAELIGPWPELAREGAYLVPEVYAWTGDADAAFEWLEKAYETDVRYGQRGFWFHRITLLPIWKKLHGDPRWDAFREKVGMSEARLAAIEFDVNLP